MWVLRTSFRAEETICFYEEVVVTSPLRREENTSRWWSPPPLPAGRMWAVTHILLHTAPASFPTLLGLVSEVMALGDLNIWVLHLSASAQSA